MPSDNPDCRAVVDEARNQRGGAIDGAYEAVARLNMAIRRLRGMPGIGEVEVVNTALKDGTVDLRVVLERDAATPSSLVRLYEAPVKDDRP